ncbi:MAG: PEP-utilizing enzyme [Candidatus Staskawiczbacteria bacterium]|jgi:pyruvate,water dikinase
MEEYKFMWGQKQSAMITEAMLSQLLLDINKNGRAIDSKINDDLCILIDGVFEHYMKNDAIQQLEENGKKSLNIEFSRMIVRCVDKHIKAFFKFSDKIRTRDLTKLSNKELKKIVIAYQEFFSKTFSYFQLSTPAGTFWLTTKIKDILNKNLKNGELIDDYFISLSSPDKMDVTMSERLDFLKLIKDNRLSEKDFEGHARKYPALFFNTYDNLEVIEFLKNRAEEEHNKDYLKEKDRIETNLKEINEKQKKIYSELGNKELKEYSKILQKNALDRYRLKHIWSGAEYLCLNLLEELQRRLEISFEDFIKCYLFEDIYKFLDRGIRLTPFQIAERKKCILAHYFNKKIHYHFGGNGLIQKNKLLKGQIGFVSTVAGESTIKGSVANKGLIQGIARIVNVKDLKQFVKDSALFKKGEILVTTMTSPVMVPIIEKANGIITDEGGITSHAAVISREFKIPCIVGTHGASSIIKTGDFIELDANLGIVKILNKK